MLHSLSFHLSPLELRVVELTAGSLKIEDVQAAIAYAAELASFCRETHDFFRLKLLRIEKT